jgi:hypothetical protein
VPLHGTSALPPKGGPHLYVADAAAGDIERYSLVNGRPQQAPDETFASVPGIEYLGVDHNGFIYGAGNQSGNGFVEKYSADGQLRGTATLSMRIATFAVDRDGYFYVAPSAYGYVAYTYAPSAFGEASAEPIATLSATGGSGHDQFVYMATGDHDRLYVAAYDYINVFDHPRKSSSSQSGSFAPPVIGWLPRFSGALAFDQTNRLYANVEYDGYCVGFHWRRCHAYFWRLTDFDAVSQPLQRNRKDHIVYAKDCKTLTDAPNGWLAGTVTGIAVYGGYIDAACTGDTAGVWVYEANDFEHQHAVEMLSGVSDPTDAKIGP